MKKLILLLSIWIMPAFSHAQDRVDAMMQKMSLREKVGQLFIVDCGHYTPTAKIDKLIRSDKIGGLIVMEYGMEEYAKQINAYQALSEIPLVISVDGEWGASMRFDTLTQYPRNMQLGALSSDELVYKVGLSMADQFRRLGIHINYAPSVDVNNNPKNPVIGHRSFGDDREKVARYGAAIMRGLQDGGIWTSAKHFPGHGDTDVDSHKALPLLSFDRVRLDSIELYPFEVMIEEGASMVMVGHLSVPALDPTGIPSSISYPIITELLKKELGFKGIVVTDALGMKGVAEYIPAETVPLESFKAGSDILLMPPADIHTCIKNVVKAVRRGEVSRERLNESLRKVLKMKEQLGILDTKPYISTEDLYREVETPEVLDLIQQVSDASITMIKRPTCGLKDSSLSDMIAKGEAAVVTLDKKLSMEKLETAKASVAGKEYVVLYVPEFRAPKNNRESYTALRPQDIYDYICKWAGSQKIVLAIMDSPYVLDKIDMKAFDGILVGYSTSAANRRAVEKILDGRIEAQGVLPVVAGGLPNGYRAE